MNYKKYGAVLICLSILAYIFYQYDVLHYLSFDYIKQHDAWMKNMVARHYVGAAILYIVGYSLIVIIPLPLSFLLNMASGYLFGLWPAIIYSAIAVMVGSVCAYTLFRYGFSLHLRAYPRLYRLVKKVQKHGASYVLLLYACMIPISLIHMIAVLANIPFSTLFWTTLIGSFPFLLIACMAGDQITMIGSGHVSIAWSYIVWAMILLCIMALMPLCLKKYEYLYTRR